jgi:two-component system, response regulator RpfG
MIWNASGRGQRGAVVRRIGTAESGGSDGGSGDTRYRGHMRLFIVDDQSTGRRILTELMQGVWPGMEIRAFSDPEAALAQVRETMPDLIVTDFRMPQMSGAQFIRAVRALPGSAEVPIVVVTVLEDRNVRYEALDAGATDFLSRPLDPVECRVRCRNLLRLRRQSRLVQHRARWLERQVNAATREILDRERETLLRLAKAGEYRDEGTGNHVLRMARYARRVAAQLGLDDSICETIELAAPMHDIGKIGVPDHILLKPGALTADERAIMERHTLMGHEILKDSASRYMQMGAVIALGHHEHWDGGGYPGGLAGEKIPLEARIVAVSDVYDALRSVRPYKPAWSREAACDYLRDEAGRQFDPDCVEAFLAVFEEIVTIEQGLRDPASDGSIS